MRIMMVVVVLVVVVMMMITTTIIIIIIMSLSFVVETFLQTHNLSKIVYLSVSCNLDLHVPQPYRLLFPTLGSVLLSK
jgi:hypothetical protein